MGTPHKDARSVACRPHVLCATFRGRKVLLASFATSRAWGYVCWRPRVHQQALATSHATRIFQRSMSTVWFVARRCWVGPVHGGGCKHGQCLMPQGTVCCLAGVQCCYKPISSLGALQRGHGRRLPVSSTPGWCSALLVYGSACQPALQLCMVMVCMLCGAQCSLCRVCASVTCRSSHRGNPMLPSGTWCCGSWRCNWHTSTAARAW